MIFSTRFFNAFSTVSLHNEEGGSYVMMAGIGKKGNRPRNVMLSVIVACLSITGCTTSRATVEPHLEKVQALLEQGARDGYPEACRYLCRLDDKAQNVLARRMVRDANPLVVYLGGALLVRQKHYDDAAPIMAALIVDGKSEGDLTSRMESDWRGDTDVDTWPHMLTRVGRNLIVNLESYTPEARKRAEHFLVYMFNLEVNKPFNREDAVTAIQKLSRGLAQESS